MMNVGIASERELQQLAEAFDTFNVVSSQLEASYSSLENRMSELRSQLADAREQRRAVSADKAILEQRLSGILEALPGGVVVLDERGVVTDANRLARNWLPGLSIGAEWTSVSREAFESEFSEHGDLVLRNGQQFVVTRESGSGTAQIILLTDVTDQRRVDEVVARHRRLAGLGEMLATLAHQLRTSITSALLYASNARQKSLGAEQREALLEKAIACLRDLEKLVADMLVFARGNTARGEQTVSIADLLDDIERSVAPHCAGPQRLRIDSSNAEVFVRGNPRVLASAIENLIINALQCSGDAAEVDVAVEVVGQDSRGADGKRRFAEDSVDSNATRCVRISVSDNGPGVPAADRRRIFEPFYSSRPGGTGLGLAAARSIARAHRGEIELDDTTESGARFVMSLPLTDKENRMAP